MSTDIHLLNLLLPSVDKTIIQTNEDASCHEIQHALEILEKENNVTVVG